MRAIALNEHGGPEVLRLMEFPIPTTPPAHIRVRVHAAAVNPTDVGTRNGSRATQQAQYGPPWVPGMDVAGVVDEIGEGCTTELRPGHEVVAIVVPQGTNGGYAEHVVVPEQSVTRAPRGLSREAASTVSMNGLTATRILQLLNLPSESATLAVTGSAGTLGGYVVQMARHQGLSVIADAAEKDEPFVRSLKPEHVVRRGAGFATSVREAVPGGVDGLADCAMQHEEAAPAVRDGGHIVTVRGYTGSTERGLSWRPVLVTDLARDLAALAHVVALAEQEVLTTRIAEVLPLEKAAEAHRRLAAGGVRGRIVLSF